MSTTTDPRPDGPVLAERPEPGAPRAYEFPTVTGRTLANGLSLVVADLPGRPLVSASLILTGGSVEEPAELGGAMVLAARALTEGTARHDAIALTEAAERLGASLHAEAGWDALTVGVDVPASRLEPALELVAEVLLEATFPESEVERLRDERLNDLLQAQADPRRRVARHRGTADGRGPPRDLPADAPAGARDARGRGRPHRARRRRHGRAPLR